MDVSELWPMKAESMTGLLSRRPLTDTLHKSHMSFDTVTASERPDVWHSVTSKCIDTLDHWICRHQFKSISLCPSMTLACVLLIRTSTTPRLPF
jgi:hypothetical protein